MPNADRSLRPGLAATKPRRDAASEDAASLVRAVDDAQGWTERDMSVVLELSKNVFAKMLRGDGAHFGLRDVLLLPTRDALALVRALEARILSGSAMAQLKRASHG